MQGNRKQQSRAAAVFSPAHHPAGYSSLFKTLEVVIDPRQGAAGASSNLPVHFLSTRCESALTSAYIAKPVRGNPGIITPEVDAERYRRAIPEKPRSQINQALGSHASVV